MDQQDARQQLEQMIREIDSTAAILEAEGAGDSSEISHSDQHPGDTASEITDADDQANLLEHAADPHSFVPDVCSGLRRREMRRADKARSTVISVAALAADDRRGSITSIAAPRSPRR